MTIEASLTTALQALCPRVAPDVAEQGTALPYVTYQGIGGRSLRWLDKTASDRRQTHFQINVWATSRAAALTLIRSIEDALCASTAFTAMPLGEPRNVTEDATPDQVRLYGCIHDFDIYSLR